VCNIFNLYWINFVYLFFCLLSSCVALCVVYVNNVFYICEMYYHTSRFVLVIKFIAFSLAYYTSTQQIAPLLTVYDTE